MKENQMFDSWTYEEERFIHERIAYALILQTPLIFGLLYLAIPSPWGKTIPSSSQWMGPLLPPRLSWCLMESPNLLWCFVCWRPSNSDMTTAHSILLFLFALHYSYRALLYPYRMSRHTTRMPLLIVLCAGTFCTLNGYLQVQALCRPFVHLPPHAERLPSFLLGVTFFFFGFSVTIQSDAILRKLRHNTPPGQHAIPYGGLFAYVSNPHYFGELLEWMGLAVATGGALPATAFVLYTAANLIPRAVTNHTWYQRQFPATYPALKRRAILPFVW